MCFLEAVQNCDSTITWLTVIVRGFSFEDWSVPSDKVFEDDSDGVTSLTDTDSLEHTCTPELLEHVDAFEVMGCEHMIWLDAADISRARFSQSHNQ